jgi:rubrerythrin
MSLLRFFGRALVKGAAGEIQKANLRRAEKKHNTVCCNNCGMLWDDKAVACFRCGAKETCSEFDFNQRKTDQRVSAAFRIVGKVFTSPPLDDVKAREKKFFSRRKELHSKRFCNPCDMSFEQTHKFCPSCGSETTKMSRERMIETMKVEFPEQFED